MCSYAFSQDIPLLLRVDRLVERRRVLQDLGRTQERISCGNPTFVSAVALTSKDVPNDLVLNDAVRRIIGS